MGMKRIRNTAVLLLLVMLSVIFVPGRAEAAEASSGVYVYDDAELFSAGERQRLAEYLKKCGQKAGVGIYVLTSDDSDSGATDRYLEDFYDAGYESGEIEKDAVLMHIDMQERYVNIQAYGKAQEKITDSTGDRIIDACFDDLRQGNYYGASVTFADKTDYYMNYVPVYLRAWVHLVAALAVGGISVGVMVGGSGGRMTANAGTYMDGARSGIRARRDEYIRTSVTKRKKPKVESSKGSGGGHVSSGGHSHSSSGRHF